MERKNAWNFYNEQDLAAVEELSIRYRRFLDAGKTERECAAESVRMAREAGYRDLLQMIHQGESLKPGDKVYISFMEKSAAFFRIGTETLPTGGDILKGVNLEIPDGKLTVITGPNGGGKTSLAKIISGVETPTSGHIILNGEDITEFDVTQRARRGIGYAFQQPVRFKGLTVRSLLELAAGESLSEPALCGLLGKVGLCARDYIDREADASLSGGEIKRVEIATLLARRNLSLAVFDEPEAGIDLWSFSGLIDVFQQLKKDSGPSMLIISHQERILQIADNIVVIADGKVRMSGAGGEVLPMLLEGEMSSQCPIHEMKGRDCL